MTAGAALVLASLLAQDPTAPPPGGSAAPGVTLSESSAGAVVRASTSLSPEPSLVGDRLELVIDVRHPVGYSVTLPASVSLPGFDVVSVDEGQPEITGDEARRQLHLVVQHFEVGDREVPSFPLTVVDPEGAVTTMDVPATPFHVTEQTAGEADPARREHDPAVSLRYPNELAERIVLAVLLGLVLGALSAWAWMRRRARRTAPPPAPPRPAHEVAFAALDGLASRRDALLTDGRLAEYFVELTEITKGYLEGRFGLDALDRTTDEIRRALLRDAARIQPLDADEVVRFLARCDLVKFARFDPGPDEAKDALSRARELVVRSVPQAASTGTSATSDIPPTPRDDADDAGGRTAA
jgi:hypothetical protein